MDQNRFGQLGPDQIDLNWHNPKMTLEFLNLIINYLSNGVKWLRLDAVGFIWKEFGTTCLHLPKAHSNKNTENLFR